MAERILGLLVMGIEFGGALILAAYCVRAAGAAWSARGATTWEHGPLRARQLIATGAIMSLNFKLAATLLKTLFVMSWNQLGILAFVIALRTILKWTFAREQGALPGA